MTAAVPGYALDNTSEAAADHLDGLAGLLDPFTRQRITGLLPDLTGKHCVEVGAGSGSIAVWLAQQVGPHGQVTATDLQPDRIPGHPRLTVLRHDLTVDALPDVRVDLVHARMVLSHLPAREGILFGLAGLLAPGGVLLVEDLDGTANLGRVLHSPDPELTHLWQVYVKRRAEIFAAAGTDRSWGRQLHHQFLRLGLQQVDTRVHAASWRGGSPGARHALGTLTQFRRRLFEAGLTEAQLGRLETALHDPDFHVCSHPLYSTAGHTPVPAA